MNSPLYNSKNKPCFDFNICLKKIWTNFSSDTILQFVQVFLKHTLSSATYLSNLKANFDSLSHIMTGISDRHKYITFIDIRIFDPPKNVFIPFPLSSSQTCACFSCKFENRLSCPLFWCKLDFSSSKNEDSSPKKYVFGGGHGGGGQNQSITVDIF